MAKYYFCGIGEDVDYDPTLLTNKNVNKPICLEKQGIEYCGKYVDGGKN